MPEIKADEKYCGSCGAIIKKEAEICPKCGIRQISIRKEHTKNPGISAVLSFFWPGLGQIYNGQIGKGIILLLSSSISAVLTLFLIGCLLYPLVWIFAIYDAYHEAERINSEAI
jgi:TM2 domain-containing membrane protein YozV